MSSDDHSNAAPSAPPGEYSYYEEAGATGAGPSTTETPTTTRPLPHVPPVPGQSSMRETAGTDRVVDGMRALQIGEPRGSQVESFFLRQLGNFKGEYNGEAITEWVERVDLLKDIVGTTDIEIIRILPLRMSARAAEFLRNFLTSRDRAEHTWANVKRALLTQFGGTVEPTQLVNKLQQARMGRNTPVREFALQVGRLARLAYPELSSDNGTAEQKNLQHSLFNRIALEQFTAGLPPLLSRPIFENRVTDFQQAVDLAAHHEEINARFMRRSTIFAIHEDEAMQHQTEAPSHYMAPINTGSASSEGYDSGPRNTNRQPTARRGGPYNRKVTGKQNRTVICHKCHNPGHYQRECPRCHICGEWGHAMPDCKNIVCASCKGTGHPANKCPKNLQSQAQTRPNSD